MPWRLIMRYTVRRSTPSSRAVIVRFPIATEIAWTTAARSTSCRGWTCGDSGSDITGRLLALDGRRSGGGLAGGLVVLEHEHSQRPRLLDAVASSGPAAW